MLTGGVFLHRRLLRYEDLRMHVEGPRRPATGRGVIAEFPVYRNEQAIINYFPMHKV